MNGSPVHCTLRSASKNSNNTVLSIKEQVRRPKHPVSKGWWQ